MKSREEIYAILVEQCEKKHTETQDTKWYRTALVVSDKLMKQLGTALISCMQTDLLIHRRE